MVKVGQKKRFGVIEVGEVGEVGEGEVGGGGAAGAASAAVAVPDEAPPEGVTREAQVPTIDSK